jgi:hypothetical protein
VPRMRFMKLHPHTVTHALGLGDGLGLEGLLFGIKLRLLESVFMQPEVILLQSFQLPSSHLQKR